MQCASIAAGGRCCSAVGAARLLTLGSGDFWQNENIGFISRYSDLLFEKRCNSRQVMVHFPKYQRFVRVKRTRCVCCCWPQKGQVRFTTTAGGFYKPVGPIFTVTATGKLSASKNRFLAQGTIRSNRGRKWVGLMLTSRWQCVDGPITASLTNNVFQTTFKSPPDTEIV